MTMPHLMNCPHSEDGWCLDCVKEMHDSYEEIIAEYREDGTPIPSRPTAWACKTCGKVDWDDTRQQLAKPEHVSYRGFDIGSCKGKMVPLYSEDAIRKAMDEKYNAEGKQPDSVEKEPVPQLTDDQKAVLDSAPTSSLKAILEDLKNPNNEWMSPAFFGLAVHSKFKQSNITYDLIGDYCLELIKKREQSPGDTGGNKQTN